MTEQLKHGDSFPFHPKLVLGEAPRCAVCNRKLKLGVKAIGVEVTNGGDVYDPAQGQADINDPGYMGFWLIGSECAKKFAPGIAY